MTIHKAKWLLVGLACLALWPAHVLAQAGQWDNYMAAATSAYQQGNYAEAEKQLSAALREAEGFGLEDLRLATSLFVLAQTYKAQGRYAEAEPLFKRALGIMEKALGPDHPHVATVLHGLATLYGDQGRYAKAVPLHKRALVIRERVLGPDDPAVATILNDLVDRR